VRRALAPGARAHRSASLPALLLLLGVAAGGLVLRLWSNDYGLPYVYNYDEETHFASKAVDMLSGGLDPSYYQNPSAYTYLVYAVVRALYGHWPAIGSLVELPLGTVTTQFAYDPTPIWIVARALAAVVTVAGVLAVFTVGRRLWDTRVGLVSAAALSFAFLPVVYGRTAVTDGGTLLPVALAAYAAVRVHETGERRHYALAGAMTGLAIGFKYTAGLVLLPLLLAVVLRAVEQAAEPRTARALAGRVRRYGPRGATRALAGVVREREAVSLLLALVAAAAVFFVTTPFFFLNPVSALYQLKTQAEAAGGAEKLGQTTSNGFVAYLRSLTWGLGYAGIAAAIGGAIVVWQRDRARAVILLVFPLALFVYMSLQSRYFARWILPLYPVLALLCAVGLVQLASVLRSPPRLEPVALALLTLVLLAQPLAADVRTAAVLGREDTRNAARDFLVAHYPPGARVAIEPALPVVPDVYYRTRPGDPGYETAEVCTGLGKGLPAAGRRPPPCLPIEAERFPRQFLRDVRRATTEPEGGPNANLTMLRPELIDRYRAQGYCTVVTMSTVRERAENAGDRRVLGYYRRLERESDLVFVRSPYRRSTHPPQFDFDLSFNYYPTVFKRPGPIVRIYRLRHCHQGFGEVPERPAGTRGLLKGVGTTFAGSS